MTKFSFRNCFTDEEGNTETIEIVTSDLGAHQLAAVFMRFLLASGYSPLVVDEVFNLTSKEDEA